MRGPARQPGNDARRMTPAERGAVIRRLWLHRRIPELNEFLYQGPMKIADPDRPSGLLFVTMSPAERTGLIHHLWASGMIIGMGASPSSSEGGWFDMF